MPSQPEVATTATVVTLTLGSDSDKKDESSPGGSAGPDGAKSKVLFKRNDDPRPPLARAIAYLSHLPGLKADLSALENLDFLCGLHGRYDAHLENIRDVIPFPRTPRNCEF